MPNRYVVLVAVALAVATLIAFSGVFQNGFVDLDDGDYVVRNPYIRQGLTRQSIAWSFTSFHLGIWHPLTWLSLALDCRLYGLNAGGFHATNLLLHVANVVLLFFLLRAATGKLREAPLWPLFALHPLHVESVAWVTERKDVLSTFFGFAALWAYTWYAARPSFRRNLLVTACLALSLLAKPMFVTFPFLALVWDFWPLGRLSALAGRTARSLGYLVLEKTPLFALSAASAVVALAAQHSAGSVASISSLSAGQRLVNVALAYTAYLGKTFWPAKLCAYYPLAANGPPLWQAATALLFLLGVTAVAVSLLRRAPYLTTGWFWYLGTLVPVIGIVQIGTQSMADRYTYVPLVGLFLIGVWGTADVADRFQAGGRRAVMVLTASLLCACALLTWRQVGYWRGPVALWQHALDVMPDNFRAKAYLAQQSLERGELSEARRLAESSLADRPNAFAHLVLGSLDFKDRKLEQAQGHFEQALTLESSAWAEARNGLGAVLAVRGDAAGAESQFRQALAADPYSATAHNNLGLALLNQDQLAEAAGWFRGAVELDPSFAAAYENLAAASVALERWNDALSACATTVDLDSNEPRYRRMLAYVLWELNDRAESKRQYKLADRLDSGWRRRAREEANKLIAASENGGYARRKSLVLARQVCEASDPAPQAADLDLLSRAYAAAGQRDKAAATAQRAIEAALAAGDADLAAEIRARLPATVHNGD